MLLHTTLLLKTLGESSTTGWCFPEISTFKLKLFACFFNSVFLFSYRHRWALLVGLPYGRPALHPWNELWLFDWGGTNSSADSSFSDRNRTPSVSSSAVSGSGRPANCLQPVAFPGPLLLLCLVDCCLPVLHFSLWPLLPSVSHGGIASPAQQCWPRPWQGHCASGLIRTEWEHHRPIIDPAPQLLLSLLPSLWPPHNHWPYHQSSWFNIQCFLYRWLCKLVMSLSLHLRPHTVLFEEQALQTWMTGRPAYELEENYPVSRASA